jgi:hypothetical protein
MPPPTKGQIRSFFSRNINIITTMESMYIAVLLTFNHFGAIATKKRYPCHSVEGGAKFIGNGLGYVYYRHSKSSVAFSTLPIQEGNYSKREIKRRKKLDKHYKSNGKPFSQSQDYFNFIYKD